MREGVADDVVAVPLRVELDAVAVIVVKVHAVEYVVIALEVEAVAVTVLGSVTAAVAGFCCAVRVHGGVRHFGVYEFVRT